MEVRREEMEGRRDEGEVGEVLIGKGGREKD